MTAEAWINKSGTLSQMRRIREPLLLMRGAVELADEVGDIDLRMRARSNLAATYSVQDLDLAVETALEALELARRLGVPGYVEWMVGGVAFFDFARGHDWDEQLDAMAEAIENASSDYIRQLFLGIRQQFLVMRGEDTSDVVAAQQRILETAGFVPFQRFDHYSAFETLLSGSPARAVEDFRSTFDVMGREVIEALSGCGIAAAYAHDADGARDAANRLQDDMNAGRGVDGLRDLGAAGAAALEGREDDAASLFVRAVERLRAAKFHFWVAVAQAVAFELLPGRPEFRGWEPEARARFESVGATPWLRLIEASGAGQQDPAAAQAPSTDPIGSRTGAR